MPMIVNSDFPILPQKLVVIYGSGGAFLSCLEVLEPRPLVYKRLASLVEHLGPNIKRVPNIIRLELRQFKSHDCGQIGMLPPVNPSVLQQNPSFANLYKDLCTRKLNPDGSTRDTKKQRIHDEIRKSLNTARTTIYTSNILLSTLSDLPSKSIPESLPPELHSVIELVTAQLSGHIAPEDREILSGDVSFFVDNITTICAAISTQLSTATGHLCTICDPKSPPQPSALATKADALQNVATSQLPSELSTARLHLANTAYAVLTQHRQLLEASIRILEQTMHGPLARATRARAELLHAKAEVLGMQAKIHTLTHPPPPEFVTALKNFKREQRNMEDRLRDRKVMARQALELYERAGEKGMRDVARRALWLKEEIERTKEEIQRLENEE